MSSLLAHAIAAAPPASFPRDGLRGRPLIWSEDATGLGLWSTEWSRDLRLERPDAFEHHRLVERICAAQPCLPVRFGTAFPSADAVRASLEERSATLHAALVRVAGKSEVALTLLWREPTEPLATPASAAGPGRAYLEARRTDFTAEEDRRGRAEVMVERLIAELAIERSLVWHETCTSASVAVSLAVLVPTERALEWKARLARAASPLESVTQVVNGPWPPYTFARAG